MHQIGVVASKLVNRWAWWQQALKDPSAIGKTLLAAESDPQQGYYRTRNKGGKWEPVAIFYTEDGDQLVGYRAGSEVADVNQLWVWCLRHPISYDAYQSAMDGQPFADEDETVSAQVAKAGHNSAGIDETEELKDQIESAKAGIDAYKTITSDEQSAKALSLRNRLNELSGLADKKREALKRPHLDAGTAIDKHWQPLVKGAKEAANTLRSAMEAWETKKLQEQRKKEREAEQARLAAEQAAREQQQVDTAVMEAPTPQPAPAPAPAPTPIKAAYGKAASVKVSVVVKDVTDYPALAVYMSNHPDCQNLLRKLAQRALDAGRTNVPGITTEERAAVR